MIRSFCFGACLIAMLGALGCTKTPGAVCRDASGRSIENPDRCKLYPSERTPMRELAYRATTSREDANALSLSQR
jgi:hypothetical protein